MWKNCSLYSKFQSQCVLCFIKHVWFSDLLTFLYKSGTHHIMSNESPANYAYADSIHWFTNKCCVLKDIYCYCYCYVAGTQGDPCTMTISDLLCILIWFVINTDLPTRPLWQLPAETSGSKTGETWQEMAAEFCLWNISFILVGFFNMP
jgi:hypothetical protein